MPAATGSVPGSMPAVVQTARGARADALHHLDKEHRRAVHDHQLAGPRTPTLTASAQASIVPADDRRAGRQPGGLGARPRCTCSDHLARPGQLRQRKPGRDQLGPVGASASRRGRKRLALAGRVVVEHVPAGQPVHQEASSPCSQRAGPGVQTSGSCRASQRSFGPTAWGGQRHPQRSRIASLAEQLGQLGDLGGRPGCRRRRGSRAAAAGRRRPRAAGTARSRSMASPASGRLAGGSSSSPQMRGEIGPPDLLGVVLHPARSRLGSVDVDGRARDDLAVRAEQDTLGATRCRCRCRAGARSSAG